MAGNEFFYLISAVLFVSIMFHICKIAKRPVRNYWAPSSNNASESRVIQGHVINQHIMDPTLVQEARNARFQAILEGVIHKKVQSKSEQINQKDDSSRSLYEIPLGDSETSESKDKDKESSVGNMDKRERLMDTLRSIRSGLNMSVKSVDVNNSSKSCPICCEDYRSGEDIVSSKNKACEHVFHTDCIIPWLMDHNDCPMCRHEFLEVQE